MMVLSVLPAATDKVKKVDMLPSFGRPSVGGPMRKQQMLFVWTELVLVDTGADGSVVYGNPKQFPRPVIYIDCDREITMKVETVSLLLGIGSLPLPHPVLTRCMSPLYLSIFWGWTCYMASAYRPQSDSSASRSGAEGDHTEMLTTCLKCCPIPGTWVPCDSTACWLDMKTLAQHTAWSGQ